MSAIKVECNIINRHYREKRIHVLCIHVKKKDRFSEVNTVLATLKQILYCAFIYFSLSQL